MGFDENVVREVAVAEHRLNRLERDASHYEIDLQELARIMRGYFKHGSVCPEDMRKLDAIAGLEWDEEHESPTP